MDYSKACKIMKYNEANDPARNAWLAKAWLRRNAGTGKPPRYSIACDTIINYAE